MKDYKCTILKQYVTKLNMRIDRENLLLEYLKPLYQVQRVIRNENIESPGPASEGRIWYSPDVVIHSFYYNNTKGANYGTQIWKRNEVILFSSSLLTGEDRINFVQVLEPGTVISISYKDILLVRDEFPEVASHLEQLIIQNDQASHHRIRLLNEASNDRVAQFEAQNPLFCAITSLAIKAMHVGLSRQGYSNVKKNR